MLWKDSMLFILLLSQSTESIVYKWSTLLQMMPDWKIWFRYLSHAHFLKLANLILAVLRLHCCMSISQVAASRGYSLIVVHRLLLLWSTGFRHLGFSSCGSWALEHRLTSCGALAYLLPRHVEFFQIRDQTPVSCISRQILYHWVTRENPCWLSKWNSDLDRLTQKSQAMMVNYFLCGEDHSLCKLLHSKRKWQSWTEYVQSFLQIYK